MFDFLAPRSFRPSSPIPKPSTGSPLEHESRERAFGSRNSRKPLEHEIHEITRKARKKPPTTPPSSASNRNHPTPPLSSPITIPHITLSRLSRPSWLSRSKLLLTSPPPPAPPPPSAHTAHTLAHRSAHIHARVLLCAGPGRVTAPVWGDYGTDVLISQDQNRRRSGV